jgi:hypothetical protein
MSENGRKWQEIRTLTLGLAFKAIIDRLIDLDNKDETFSRLSM